MRTPSEFEPLGYWMGWEKLTVNGVGYWTNCDGVVIYEVSEKTSLTDAEAVEALRRLVEKGYYWDLHFKGCYFLEVYIPSGGCRIHMGRGKAPTISAAVEEALLKMIAAEGGKE